MKTRFRIIALTMKLGFIYVFFGFIGEIWWAITGKENFADRLAKPILEKLRKLDKRRL